MRRSSLLAFLVVLLAICRVAPAWALTAEVTVNEASLVDETVVFRAVVQDAVGAIQYRWTFGDGTPRIELAAGTADVSHVYARPGRYFVQLLVQDQAGTASVYVPHLVHYPLKARRPTASTSIVYDKPRGRVYAVNQDNDSITSIDAAGLTKVAELPVYRRPEALAIAPDGKLWVVHRDDYALAIVDLDRFVVERGLRLPYASQPVGLAMSPAGRDAYVTLMALGKLLKLDVTTGQVVGDVDVGPWPRGVSVSDDGQAVYVTRFISPDGGGEVIEVDGAALKVRRRIQLAPDTTTMDSDRGARGLPNYLFSVAISPDGLQAWITGKKDNIFRGTMRDQLTLNQDDTVRPLVSIVDLAAGAEVAPSRIDLDDRSLPAHIEFSERGDFAFITVAASNLVEVRNVYDPAKAWTIIADAGVTPRASVLGPDRRLFVQGSLSRNVVVYDLTAILVSSEATTPPRIADISTVEHEKLAADVLMGKRMFHSAGDTRMTAEGYLTCGTCHFEGIDDGRVYDFSSRGEGLRNTVALLGRRGTGHGPVNWSGNQDEIQDFEMQIRELFTGRGFIADDLLAVGTRKEPFGDPKAGLSKEMDALAAYLTTLDHVNPSPFRNPDGSMTADARAGQVLFGRLGCDFCHAGADFTDSERRRPHDVGTLSARSGNRSGKPLLGIDTPTLLGVWETAPYLHDGSAATLRDVLTTKNSGDQHGFVSALTSSEVDQLVAYLRELDNELPLRRLPFEPEGTGADGGAPEARDGDAGGGAGGRGGGDAGTAAEGPRQLDSPAGCTCELADPRGGAGAGAAALLFLATLATLASGRRRRRDRAGRRPRTGDGAANAIHLEGQP